MSSKEKYLIKNKFKENLFHKENFLKPTKIERKIKLSVDRNRFIIKIK